MANAAHLSAMHMGMDLASSSQPFDRPLFNTVSSIRNLLSDTYGVELTHRSCVFNYEISTVLDDSDGERRVFHPKSHMRPDGGVITIDVDGVPMPILAAENKKQGDGKKQAMGNAVERAVKNFALMDIWTQHLDINPFVFFCWGTDFRPGSSIPDRLLPITMYREYNRQWVTKTQRGKGGGSVYISVTPFEQDFLFNTCAEIAETALEHMLDRYWHNIHH